MGYTRGMKLRQIEIDTVDQMSNEELFDEYSYVVQPDDYDGCFTPHGNLYREYVEYVIRERLKDWFKQWKMYN